MKLSDKTRLLDHNLLLTYLSYCEQNKEIDLHKAPAQFLEEIELVGPLIFYGSNSHSFSSCIIEQHFICVECFNLCLELRVAKVYTLGTYVLVSEHTAKNVTLGEEVLNRHYASFF